MSAEVVFTTHTIKSLIRHNQALEEIKCGRLLICRELILVISGEYILPQFKKLKVYGFIIGVYEDEEEMLMSANPRPNVFFKEVCRQITDRGGMLFWDIVSGEDDESDSEEEVQDE